MTVRTVCFTGILAVGLASIACSSNSTPTGGGTNAENFFFDAARNTAPAITPTSAASSGSTLRRSLALGWEWGNPVYEMFNALRDYDNDRDEGSIGLDNVYKTLFQAGQFYANDRAACLGTGGGADGGTTDGGTDGVMAPKVVASPFDFGNSVTYDCAMNDQSSQHGHASREVGSAKHGLMSWRVDHASTGGAELGVIQGSLDETTQEIQIDEATYVDYPLTTSNPTGMDFALRFHIEGNAATHAFTLKLMKWNSGDGYWISLAGKGVSRGAGNHFLFKMRDQSNATALYFCFPADLTEAQMKEIQGTTTAAADCAAYQADVDLLGLYESTDVPTTAESFTAGSIYLTF